MSNEKRIEGRFFSGHRRAPGAKIKFYSSPVFRDDNEERAVRLFLAENFSQNQIDELFGGSSYGVKFVLTDKVTVKFNGDTEIPGFIEKAETDRGEDITDLL